MNAPIRVVLMCENGDKLEFMSTYDEYGLVSTVTFDGKLFNYSPCKRITNTVTFIEVDTPKQVEIDWNDSSVKGTPTWLIPIRDGAKGK